MVVPTSAPGPEVFSSDFSTRVAKLGRLWREDSADRQVEKRLQQLWRRVVAAWDHPILCPEAMPDWGGAALELMAISDEASAQMGLSIPDVTNSFAVFFAQEHFGRLADHKISKRGSNGGRRVVR
jgi:hypothetical protein